MPHALVTSNPLLEFLVDAIPGVEGIASGLGVIPDNNNNYFNDNDDQDDDDNGGGDDDDDDDDDVDNGEDYDDDDDDDNANDFESLTSWVTRNSENFGTTFVLVCTLLFAVFATVRASIAYARAI